MSIINNCKESYKHIAYTFKHYLAFLKVEKKLLGTYKYKFHDWDKIIMFIFLPFLGKKKISNIHRRISKHHPTYKSNDWIYNKNAEKIDWYEAIIDWECARYTKCDKPLNARQTMEKFYPQFRVYCEPILDELNL